MKNFCKELESDGYYLKFILNNKLEAKRGVKSKRIAILIDEDSTLYENKIIEDNIKRNNEVRVFQKTKKEIMDVL